MEFISVHRTSILLLYHDVSFQEKHFPSQSIICVCIILNKTTILVKLESLFWLNTNHLHFILVFLFFFFCLFCIHTWCHFYSSKIFFVKDLIVLSQRVFPNFRSVLSLLLDVNSFVSFRSTLGNPCSKDHWANIPSVRLHEWNLWEYMYIVNEHFSTELKRLTVIFISFYPIINWCLAHWTRSWHFLCYNVTDKKKKNVYKWLETCLAWSYGFCQILLSRVDMFQNEWTWDMIFLNEVD